MKDKKRYFKNNEDYFKFYAKMKEKIKVKSIHFTKNNIVMIYREEVAQ